MISKVLATVSLLAASLTQVAAQSNYPNQSAPFNLVLESSNTTLNGRGLISCHTGAAIESLCLTSGSPSTYYFNTSSYAQAAGYPQSGALTWVLQGSNFNVSEAMVFSIDPASNVALPLFEPTNTAQLVAFTTNSTGGYMAVAQYTDDTVVPATSRMGTLLQRWFVCQTYYTGYRYTTLTWTLGNQKPQNPTCQSVKVKRVFK